MTMTFRKAERKKAKLRLGISGASGSGKTFSALKVAFGLGGSVAVVDTENGSADLYAHLGDYDVLTLEPPYTPEKYIEAIKAAERGGYATVILDSASHAWAGEGGLLDQQGKIADSGRGNSYTAWRSITPKHNALVEAMLQSSCHIIATVRAKTEYVQEKNNRGTTEIKRVGLSPVQRDGFEYEFTVFIDMSADHTATASKDRTGLLDGQYFKPSEETGRKLLGWLNAGTAEPAPEPTPTGADTEAKKAEWGRTSAGFWATVREAAQGQGIPAEQVEPVVYFCLGKVFGLEKLHDLTVPKLKAFGKRLAEPAKFAEEWSAWMATQEIPAFEADVVEVEAV